MARIPSAKPSRLLKASALAAVLSLGATVPLWLQATENADPLGEKTGGATSVPANGRNAFSFPLANLDDEGRTRFAIGNSFFRRNWVEAPASTTARDGLGPHFIARSCGGCHVQDGRGAPPDLKKTLRGGEHEPPVGLLIRLSVPGTGEHGDVVPEPVYGGQFNNAAIQGVQPEGKVKIRTEPLVRTFADGSRVTLRKPVYTLTDLAYGPMAKDAMLSPRVAPQLAGIGLLEAIPDAEIERNAADQAAAPGPVKGQVNRVWDAFAGETRLGRLGWKANVATLAHQTAGAFNGDIGITSSRFAGEGCTAAQKDCLDAPHGGGKGAVIPSSQASAQVPEIDDETLSHVIFYQATLAPAERRNARDPQVLRGQALFAQAQCSACHRPSYTTGQPPFPQFSSPKVEGQRIWPHTDLLLHDMGPDLADGRPDFLAQGRQWKTPPLWGVGLIREVNGHQRLLHDGRADGVLEAILWHGGEAESARKTVQAMSRADRAALVKFVESL